VRRAASFSVMSVDMEYSVRFSLTIHNHDGSKAAFFGKRLTLPFVPFIGLRLAESEGVTEAVESVVWSAIDQEFRCHINSSEVEMADGYDLDMAFLIDQAKANGWEGTGRVYDTNS
jgi:hypothetical protein